MKLYGTIGRTEFEAHSYECKFTIWLKRLGYVALCPNRTYASPKGAQYAMRRTLRRLGALTWRESK